MIHETVEFFSDFKPLENTTIHPDYLPNSTPSCGIFPAGENPQVKVYADGEAVFQYVFILKYRAVTDEMGDTNLDSAQLFEELSEWIYEKNEKGDFPKIQGIIPLWLEVVSSGAQKKTDSKSAVYEIKLRLVYEKEK